MLIAWYAFTILVVIFLCYDYQKNSFRRWVSGFYLVLYGGGLVALTVHFILLAWK